MARPNALSAGLEAEIASFILDYTRPSPEKMELKAIDPKMSTNLGIYRGFVARHGPLAEPTFRRLRVKVLKAAGYKTSIVGAFSDHNVCAVCFTLRAQINSLQLTSADKKRSGEAAAAAALLVERDAVQIKYDAHVQKDVDFRTELFSFVDGGKVLRKLNLETGVYEHAARPFCVKCALLAYRLSPTASRPPPLAHHLQNTGPKDVPGRPFY